MGNYCAGNIARRSAVPKLGGGAATAIALAGLAILTFNLEVGVGVSKGFLHDFG